MESSRAAAPPILTKRLSLLCHVTLGTACANHSGFLWLSPNGFSIYFLLYIPQGLPPSPCLEGACKQSRSRLCISCLAQQLAPRESCVGQLCSLNITSAGPLAKLLLLPRPGLRWGSVDSNGKADTRRSQLVRPASLQTCLGGVALLGVILYSSALTMLVRSCVSCRRNFNKRIPQNSCGSE